MTGSPVRHAGRDGSNAELTRHEETLEVLRHWVPDGTVRACTTVETLRVDETVPRRVVYADCERSDPEEVDDGEVHVLDDGSLSIPVLEEQIVVTKRTVVRERIILRKKVVTETVRIEDEVRREHVEVDAPRGIEVTERHRGHTAPFPGSSADPRRTRVRRTR